jgi:predicted  nucleic acid-binding Zn-ribbon protein
LAEKGKSVEKLNEDIQLKESEKTSLQEKIASLEENYKTLEKKYDLTCNLLDESKQYANKAVTLLESADADVGSRFTASEYIQIVEKLEEAEDEKEKADDEAEKAKEEADELKKQNESLTLRVASLRAKIIDLREKVEGYEKEIEDGLMNEEEPVDTIDYSVPADEFDYSEFGDTMAPEDDELELDVNNDSEVEEFYSDLVDEDPRYESVRQDILKCKTLIEAQRTAMRLKKLIENIPGSSKRRVTESFIKESEANVANIKPKGWL